MSMPRSDLFAVRFAPQWPRLALAGLLGLALMACGGGGGVSDACCTSGIPSGPLPTTLEPVVAGHIERLIEVRAAMGQPGLLWSAALQRAAESHAAYQRQNNTFGHGELAGQPGFTGVGVGDRARAQGYTRELVSEIIIGGNPQTREDGRTSMDVLLAAPGHRLIALCQELRDIGSASRPLTTVMGGECANGPVGSVWIYPYDGQTGVLKGFAPASETPSPLPGVTVTGIPLTVHSNIFTTSLNVRSAQLVRLSDHAVVDLFTTQTLGQPAPAYIFYPTPGTPLDANTVYRFTVEVSPLGGPFETRVSTFTTGAV
ncbi:MAG: CAP domain-containing protein [Burkholderiaceae bacterium]|nr:CAP domain-containing protein [Burkholderiaceae bacterium]MDZ4146379.1 CAP domain-containing protein [Burkholderiales bacterium]